MVRATVGNNTSIPIEKKRQKAVRATDSVSSYYKIKITGHATARTV